MLIRTLLLLSLLLWAAPVQAFTTDSQEDICATPAVFFCENFEARTVASMKSQEFVTKYKNSGWEVSDTSMSVVTSQFFDGSKAMQWNYPAGNGGAGYIDAHFAGKNEIYIRFYMKNESNWVWSTDGNKMVFLGGATVPHNILFDQGVFGGDKIVFRPQYCTFTAPDQACAQPFHHANVAGEVSWPLTADGGGAPAGSHPWVCVESRWKYNSGVTTNDAETDIWIDQVLHFQYRNLNLDRFDTTISTVAFSGFWNPGTTSHPLMHRWIDNIVVSTARIGCLGAAPVADTVPPTVPTGLTATPSGGSVSLAWTASTDASGIANYPILRCTGASCTPSTILTTVNAPTVTYVDTTVAAGIVYNYAVKAVDNASPANTSTATTAVQITAPTFFRTTLGTDNFNRVDNTDLGSSWDAGYTNAPTHTNATLISQQIRATTLDASEPKSVESYNAVATPDDQWCQVTLGNWAGSADMEYGCAVRMANPPTIGWYWCYARKNNATRTSSIASHHPAGVGDANIAFENATTWAPGDKIRCEAQGTTIREYRIPAGTTNEILLNSATDTDFSSGKTGVLMWMNTGGTLSNGSLDDFAMGGFSAAVGTNPISVDAVSSSAADNTTNSITWNHTVGSGTNRLLAVCTYARDTVTGDLPVLSVTANGLALTKVRGDTETSGGAKFSVEQWYLTNPGSGTNSIVVNWTNPLSSYGVGSAISYSGVDQTNPIDANTGTNGTTANPSRAITTVADHALIQDCTLDSTSGAVVGSGQTERVNRLTTSGTDSTLISTVGDKTPAGAETMDWTVAAGSWAISAMSLLPATVTPVVEPNITAMTLTATGITGITYNATTPTQIRVDIFTNSGLHQSFIRPISDFTGGNFTYTWPDGYNGVCLFAINSTGIEINTPTTTYVCGSLAGLVAAADTTPIVLTQALPTGTLNQGTTSTTFAVSMNKNGSVKWDTVNTTYALMANTMNVASLTASASTGAILSDGTTTHVYVQACFSNSLSNDICTTTALDIPITVSNSAPSDTTKPSDVTNLSCNFAVSNSQVPCSWTASTDNVAVTGYQLYVDFTGACTSFTPAALPVTTTFTIVNLPASTTVSIVARAFDAAGNFSNADSNCQTGTTTALADVIPPSTMTNLQVIINLQESIVLGYDQGTDDRGSVTAIIEQCTGAGCTNFSVIHPPQVGINQVLVNLTPGTAYRFRGLFSDGTNVSVAYSNIVDVTTMTTGLPRLRTQIPFGQQRLPRTP